jgi:hypothetical protein
MREWCWLQTAWLTIQSVFSAIVTSRGAALSGSATLFAIVEGHEFEQTEDWNVLARVQVARCRRCGKFSVGWYSENPVAPSSRTTNVILRAEAVAKELRSWECGESRVDYDGPMGRSWLIVHLLDALKEEMGKS